MTIRYTRQAISDVTRIADFIREQNPSAAVDVEQAIRSTIDLLGEFPMLGRDRSDLNARALGIPRYPFTVYYRAEDKEIWIVHIRDDRRRPPEPDEL
jgi:plasmid stabilization system protein ParE